MNQEVTETRLPPINPLPRWGFYPWWPATEDPWLHPEDESLARTLIPSPRVWKLTGQDSEGYTLIRYGSLVLRVRPTMWIELRSEGLEIDDWVEVLPLGMRNTPQLGRLSEIHWRDQEGELAYQIRRPDDSPLETWFTRADLKQVEPPHERSMAYREPPVGPVPDLEIDP